MFKNNYSLKHMIPKKRDKSMLTIGLKLWDTRYPVLSFVFFRPQVKLFETTFVNGVA